MPYDLLTPDGLDLIEAKADQLMAEVGINVNEDADRDLFREAGASLEGTRVRFEPGHLRELVSTAPSEFTQHARNPDKSVVIGGDAVVFAPAYGSPFVRVARRLRELRQAHVRVAVVAPLRRDDLRTGRRPGQQASPRHGVRPHPVQRSGVHGFGHPAAAGP
jgi:trimethylamine:corrinoid methyltransferase-like protein